MTKLSIHADPIIRIIHTCAVARVPLILWGPPGSGKTARVAAYARTMALHYERWLLSRCEPIDLAPRAITAKGVALFDPPEVTRLRKASEEKEGALAGILFADELNRAEKATEGAALNLFDSPPPGVFVVAACNPPRSTHSARHLDSQTANRFVHVDVTPNAERWADAQVHGWGVSRSGLVLPPAERLEEARKISAVLIGQYIRAQPHRLEEEPNDPITAGRAWASTRTWEYAIALHAAACVLDLDEEDVFTLLEGAIGPVAHELIDYIENLKLPRVEDLLLDPRSWLIPAEADRCYATAMAIASAVKTTPTVDRYDAAWILANRLAELDQGTAAVLLANQLLSAWQANKTFAPPQKRMGARIAGIMDVTRKVTTSGYAA